jgi:1-acyl-sn-glycerol-3-phosphate acyltransferase
MLRPLATIPSPPRRTSTIRCARTLWGAPPSARGAWLAMSALLAPLRIAALLAHVLAGLLISGAIFPWLAQRNRNRIIRAWSRLLLALCGVRLRLAGLPLLPEIARTGIGSGSRGRLLLANHVSWLDVFAIHAALPSRFVAKSEIRRWPLLGLLVTLVGTLYIERGRRHAVHTMNHQVREKLQRGETVAVFPEGTTTDGGALLPFHANLIAPAIDVGAECWPVALRYTQNGAPSRAAAFVGDMSLPASLWNILRARRLQVEVAFLQPVRSDDGSSRHHIAEAAAERIAAWLDVPPPRGRRFNGATVRGADTADSAPAATGATASKAR